MDAAQLATLLIVSVLGAERALANYTCNLSESLKRLHLQCSSCCDVDVEARTPPGSPTTPPRLSNPLVEAPPSRV